MHQVHTLCLIAFSNMFLSWQRSALKCSGRIFLLSHYYHHIQPLMIVKTHSKFWTLYTVSIASTFQTSSTDAPKMSSLYGLLVLWLPFTVFSQQICEANKTCSSCFSSSCTSSFSFFWKCSFQETGRIAKEILVQTVQLGITRSISDLADAVQHYTPGRPQGTSFPSMPH